MQQLKLINACIITLNQFSKHMISFCGTSKNINLLKFYANKFSVNKQQQLKSSHSKLVKNQRLKYLDDQLIGFKNNFDMYLQAAMNSPYNYLSLFTRCCLIATKKKLIKTEMFYPTLKKRLAHQSLEFTPFSCAALMECLSYLKFQGDENLILNKLCKYYETYYWKFTWTQQAAFWENYMKIMGQKAHASVNFINLQRQKLKSIEQTTVQELIKKNGYKKKCPKSIVSQINVSSPDEVSLVLSPPSSPKHRILLHIKSLTNFNDYQRVDQQTGYDNRLVLAGVIKQIKSFKNSAKKGWYILFVGELEKWERDEKYRSTKTDQNGNQLGYIKSERIIDESFGNQNLNSKETLMKLQISKRYINGLFYTSNNKNKSRIDTFTTLMLGSLTSMGQQIPQLLSASTNNIPSIANFLSLPFLQQAYGYCKICEQLSNINKNYMSLQSTIRIIDIKNKEDEYFLEQIDELMEEKKMTEEQAKYQLAQNTKTLAQMAVKSANEIDSLWFQKRLQDDGISIVNDLSWQFKPLFGVVTQIIEKAEAKMREKPNEDLKLKLIIQKKHLAQVLQHIFQAKYWRVPKYGSSDQQNKVKMQILEQILKYQPQPQSQKK